MSPIPLHDNAKHLFHRSQVCTVPNLLSLFRLCLIPVLFWACRIRSSIPLAIAVLLASCLTDILDGVIARKYDQVSDLGKILDPLADKLTQLILMISLIRRHWAVLPLLILFCIKEIVQATLRYLVLRTSGEVHSAKWFGKASTILLFLVMGVLILFPKLTGVPVFLMILGCAIMLIFSLIRYALLDLAILHSHAYEKV